VILQNESVLDNLELNPAWTAKVGPQYNAVSSTSYWTKLNGNIREFGHVAPALGGWLSGLNDLPIPEGFGNFSVIHKARVMFDGSIFDWTTGSRIAAEFDNRVADGLGNNFNFSEQLNLSAGWMWQVDNQTGNWTNAVRIAALDPLTWYDLEYENSLDLSALKLSFISLTVRKAFSTADPVAYLAPASLHGLTPMKDAAGKFWTRGANLQMQQCRQTAGVGLLWAHRIGMKWIPA
jgi:hypothetical protein